MFQTKSLSVLDFILPHYHPHSKLSVSTSPVDADEQHVASSQIISFLVPHWCVLLRRAFGSGQKPKLRFIDQEWPCHAGCSGLLEIKRVNGLFDIHLG